MENLDKLLPNTAASSIASHVDLVKNTSEMVGKITAEHKKSASIIKNFLKNPIAAQSYGEMFSNGSFFRRAGNDLPKPDSKFSSTRVCTRFT
jgi:hypothetical protein